MPIIIPQPKKIAKIIKAIKKDGPDKLHVLADFDRTLTYHSVNNVPTPSLIAILRNGHYLSTDYAKKAHALFDKYQPIEKNPDLPLAKKKKAMDTWWRTHKKLLIDSGLNKKDLRQIVQDPHIKFRHGFDWFLNYLKIKNIPLVILSASGIGEAIPLYFKNAKKNYKNIYYLVNSLKWSKSGKALAIREPIIHSLNKDETVIKDFPKIYKKIKHRSNVLLLGDNISDIDMVVGFDYKNLLRVGFLNYDDPKIKKAFLKNFDIIISGDGDFKYLNTLIKTLCVPLEI